MGFLPLIPAATTKPEVVRHQNRQTSTNARATARAAARRKLSLTVADCYALRRRPPRGATPGSPRLGSSWGGPRELSSRGDSCWKLSLDHSCRERLPLGISSRPFLAGVAPARNHPSTIAARGDPRRPRPGPPDPGESSAVAPPRRPASGQWVAPSVRHVAGGLNNPPGHGPGRRQARASAKSGFAPVAMNPSGMTRLCQRHGDQLRLADLAATAGERHQLALSELLQLIGQSHHRMLDRRDLRGWSVSQQLHP